MTASIKGHRGPFELSLGQVSVSGYAVLRPHLSDCPLNLAMLCKQSFPTRSGATWAGFGPLP